MDVSPPQASAQHCRDVVGQRHNKLTITWPTCRVNVIGRSFQTSLNAFDKSLSKRHRCLGTVSKRTGIRTNDIRWKLL